MNETGTRAGTVTLIGLPNAGKSSLLNRFLGAKLSIVSPFAQTTRERVVGIDTRDGVQMIFLDTPGILRPTHLLHRALAAILERSMADADVLVLVLDGTRPVPTLPEGALAMLKRMNSSLVAAVNKSDVAAETDMIGLSEWVSETMGVEAVRVSARTGDGIEELRARVAARLPESPFLYPVDEMSTQPVRFFVAELIRETVFEHFSEEIPYSVAVRIEEYREAADPVFIRAGVLVERASQKAILIGKGGRAIRTLGTEARRKIEDFLERHVYLDLRVKVVPKWRKSPLELGRLGFVIPEEKN